MYRYVIQDAILYGQKSSIVTLCYSLLVLLVQSFYLFVRCCLVAQFGVFLPCNSKFFHLTLTVIFDHYTYAMISLANELEENKTSQSVKFIYIFVANAVTFLRGGMADRCQYSLRVWNYFVSGWNILMGSNMIVFVVFFSFLLVKIENLRKFTKNICSVQIQTLEHKMSLIFC